MKAILDNLDDVPESLRGEYESHEGKYRLKVEGTPVGFVPSSDHVDVRTKLSEFRDTTTSLYKDIAELAGVSEASSLAPLKELITKLKDIDPEEHKKIKAKLAELEKKGAKPDDVAAQIATAVSEAINPLKKQLEAEHTQRVESDSKRADADKRADRAMLRNAIGGKLSEAGARSDALSYLLDKSEESFHVQEEKVVAKANVYSKDPAKATGGVQDALGLDEWVKNAVSEYAFAFEPSGGGGTPTNKPGPGGTYPRPNAKVLVNPSPQEIGRNMDDIRAGKVRIENTT